MAYEQHGMSQTPEWYAWLNMKARCSNPKLPNYKDYGGRGITVCDEWSDKFSSFYKDLGPKPTPSHTLERKDVNGNYEPGNVVWADWTTQIRNRRVRHDNVSGVTGVTWDKRYKYWVVSVKVNYKKIHVGSFKDINKAIEARKEAEAKHYV